MGWLSKINEKRKKATNKVLSPFTKGFAKISDKIIPNELRWMAPYAAGIGTLDESTCCRWDECSWTDCSR